MYDRWHGWPEMPVYSTSSGKERSWYDLSHRLNEDLPRIPFFPQPRFEKIMAMPENPMNVTEMKMACHVGTHIDAPRHFIPDAPTVDQIPLDRLCGSGVVWRIHAEPEAVIGRELLERMRPKVGPGDMVLFDTGWARHFGTERYNRHPFFSEDAAEWLVKQQVKLIGVDFATPDLNAAQRPSGFNWPVHHILLSQGVLVAEHLTNLTDLAEKRIEVMLFALNIEGADGAPVRVVARVS